MLFMGYILSISSDLECFYPFVRIASIGYRMLHAGMGIKNFKQLRSDDNEHQRERTTVQENYSPDCL